MIHETFAFQDGVRFKTEVIVAEVHSALVKHGHRVHSAAADDEVAAGELGTKNRYRLHSLLKSMVSHSRRIHCSKHNANELVLDHDAVQEGYGPLHAVFVLGVFDRGDDADEGSEGFEAAFDALGGGGS